MCKYNTQRAQRNKDRKHLEVFKADKIGIKILLAVLFNTLIEKITTMLYDFFPYQGL